MNNLNILQYLYNGKERLLIDPQQRPCYRDASFVL
jgi:hypothetical protein